MCGVDRNAQSRFISQHVPENLPTMVTTATHWEMPCLLVLRARKRHRTALRPPPAATTQDNHISQDEPHQP